jgi:hypothetical protein
MVLLHAKKAQKGGRSIALPIPDPNTGTGWVFVTTPQWLYLEETDLVITSFVLRFGILSTI